MNVSVGRSLGWERKTLPGAEITAPFYVERGPMHYIPFQWAPGPFRYAAVSEVLC